ncbi:uncharacterized protein LOC123516907 [Portunus trituberculatus]|uniref:uncharacterized protein LOC123516907 n=1 Tax=Portunus trituberculatus TaxID=210409 RepID=UPI001E1D1F30|nr:uncharacterized protein LOC123516907 [Portunus trituberculatus]
MKNELLWPRSVIRYLCELIEGHRFLWDPQNVDYPKHKLRLKVFGEIAQEIKAQYPAMTTLTAVFFRDPTVPRAVHVCCCDFGVNKLLKILEVYRRACISHSKRETGNIMAEEEDSVRFKGAALHSHSVQDATLLQVWCVAPVFLSAGQAWVVGSCRLVSHHA